jgi:hypothetical protein
LLVSCMILQFAPSARRKRVPQTTFVILLLLTNETCLTAADSTQRPALRIPGPTVPRRHHRPQSGDRPPRRGVETRARTSAKTNIPQETRLAQSSRAKDHLESCCCSSPVFPSPGPEGYFSYRERHVGANSPIARCGKLPVTGSGFASAPVGDHPQVLHI